MKEFVKSITSPYEKELIETRRYLHRHPELSFQETDTAAYIRSTLNALGIPLMEGISGTSTVAVIKGEKTGPCIAFRADIDALPVEEKPHGGADMTPAESLKAMYARRASNY